MLGNLCFKDEVMSSNLFKLRIYLLELLIILFVDGYLLVTNCSRRFSRLGLDWLALKDCCLMENLGGFWGLVFGLN